MSYLTEKERYTIEVLLKEGYTQREIAKKLGRHYNTIYNEIKRGTIQKLDSELVSYSAYDAYRGQSVNVERGHNKGRGLKIGNNVQLADFIERQVLEARFSPYAALELAKRKSYNVNFSLRTLYNYINSDVFLTLCRKHIHSKKKKVQTLKKVCLHNVRARSIEDRPDCVNSRRALGHWEMDTVVSGRGDLSCLLVLTERKTRFEIIRRLPDKTALSVQRALDDIEIHLSRPFSDVFRSITVDNGAEFLNCEGIERSCVCDSRRTCLYYCHPYASSERGSNENANRLIRRHIPKGSLISSYTDDYIQGVQDWMNHYPRRMFDGRSSYEVLCQLLA